MKPSKHLGRGDGCPKCGGSISKNEIKWLDDLNIDGLIRNKSLPGMRIKPDGFDPSTNTVYEYYGDYWHGNPKVFDPSKTNPEAKKTYRALYQKTLERENRIKEAGYNLITIWESDFLAQQKKKGA